MKKLFCLIFTIVFMVSLSVSAFAANDNFNYNYGFSSGADTKSTFGNATSTDEPVSPNSETENIRRNKDAAFSPPPYGVFSGNIPTDRSSPYHDNTPPYAGYTGNPSTNGEVSYDGNSVSPTNGTDFGGMLPSTSIMSGGNTTNTVVRFNEDGSIGTLSIPKLNKTLKVYEGETLENMKKGIGHFEFTSMWDGNVGFAGHNRGASAYFSFVKDLVIGDKITYTTEYGTRTYEVFSKEKISETDYSALSSSPENIITLITCVENVPNLRYCVQARQIS